MSKNLSAETSEDRQETERRTAVHDSARCGSPVSRVMVLQRDLNDKPVPPHRKAAPTAQTVARAEAALRAHGVEVVGQGSDADVDFVLVIGGDGTILRACELVRGAGELDGADDVGGEVAVAQAPMAAAAGATCCATTAPPSGGSCRWPPS